MRDPVDNANWLWSWMARGLGGIVERIVHLDRTGEVVPPQVLQTLRKYASDLTAVVEAQEKGGQNER